MENNNEKKELIGDLSSMPLADVFQWIALSKRTGELYLQSDNDEISISFIKGEIAHASTNQPRFLLGQLLLQFGKIDKQQLIKSLGIQKKEQKALGKVLVELSHITSEDLEEIIHIQVRDVVFYILTLKSCFFNFIDKEITTGIDHLVQVDEVLMKCMKRIDLYNDMLEHFNEKSILKAKGYEGRLKQYINSKNNVSRIIRLAGGDWFDIYKEIFNGITNGQIVVLEESEEDIEDPVLEFLVALELFNKNKIYESYKIVHSLVRHHSVKEQIRKFYSNLKLFISRYFYKNYGGENSCFSLNRAKLSDEDIHISATEGFVLSRIEEYPCVNMLEKAVNLDKVEIFLIIDKLYRLNLLSLKRKLKNKTELIGLDVISGLLSVYKRELSGEMEIITEDLTARLFFNGGRLKFLFSTTDKYDIKRYLVKKGSYKINEKAYEQDVEGFIQKLMNDNDLSVQDLQPIFKIYQNMIFYELLSHKVISIIFYHEKNFPGIFNININLVYLIIFSVVSNNIILENKLDFFYDYELLKDKQKLLEETAELNIVRQILDDFEDNYIGKEKLKNYDKTQLSILNMFFKLGYLREVAKPEVPLEDLQSFLAEIRNKNSFEIFGVDENSFDLDSIKEQYIKFTKKYHPDLFANKEHKETAQEIFEMIKSAYDYLLEEEQHRKNKNEEGTKVDVKSIFMAEQLITSGRVYLNMGRMSDAIDAFKRAYENYSDDEEVKAYYGLAKVRSGEQKKGFEILKECDIESFDEPELYIAYIEAAIKLKKKKEASALIDKAIAKYSEYSKRLNAYKSRLKHM